MSSAAIENLGGSLKEIGDFEIVKKLGQGGMGSVFLARQKSLDRQVALKVIAPSFANNADFIARFQREARAVGNLNHPHIVQGIDFGRDDKTGLWHFAMEFVNGPSVSGLLKQGPLDEERALKITLQIAQALEFAHKRGFIHRDIKPDNILLTSGGDAKLADLGLAKHADADASLTQTGLAVGSPHYISPEQASGDATIDIRCDIYSLGVTLFHMVTGKPPFDGATPAVIMVKHIKDEVPSAKQFNPKVSDACGRLIARMTRRDRNQRFKTPAELVEKIEQLLSGQATAEIREPVAPRPARGAADTHSSKSAAKPRAQKQNDALVFAGIGAGVLVLGLIVWAVAGQGSTDTDRAPDKKVAAAPPNLANADAAKPEAEPARPAPPRIDPKPAPEPAIAPRRPADTAPVLIPTPEQPAAPVVFKLQPLPVAPDKEAAVKAPPADVARLNAVLDKFDAEAMKKNFPEAVRIAKEAGADAALAGVAREVHDLGDLAQALTAEDAARLKSLQALMDGKPHTLEVHQRRETGVVEKVSDDQVWLRIDMGGGAVGKKQIKFADLSDAERKRLMGDFKAATPAEHLAAAIQALAAKDAESAKLEAAAAAGDSLAQRYLDKARELETAKLEETARAAWEALHITAAAPANAKAAEEELKKLADFEKAFGQTRFAASIADKIAEAKAAAQKAIGFVTGIFIMVRGDFVEFKPDGARDSEKYIIDMKNNPDLVNSIPKSVTTCNRAKVQWKEWPGNAGMKQLVSIEVLPRPREDSGVMTGKVVAVDGVMKFLDIQTESGEYNRLIPNNHGGDPNFTPMVSKLKIGDKVSLHWVWELRLRLVSVEVLAP